MRNERFDLSRLASSGLIQRLEFHQSLSSTNDRAELLAAEDSLACPAIVLAAEQTAGRGRGGNRWWSVPGGLMFSLVLPAGPQAQNSPATWPGCSLAAGLAICEALDQLCSHAHFTVKWPNDVYANERKICGVLIEAPGQAHGRLIVGVGINVNNSFAQAPPDLQQTATALCDLDGVTRDLTTVLLVVLQRLTETWQQLGTSGFESLRNAWTSRSLLTGRIVHIQAGTRVHIGRCLGIDDSGALLLQTESGRQAVHAGSVLRFE
jgi:BirA family biotin operon repressor/biotin-[acetyl-CoA-carboxylase] ligase